MSCGLGGTVHFKILSDSGQEPGTTEQPHGCKQAPEEGAEDTILPRSRAALKGNREKGLDKSPESWKQAERNPHFCQLYLATNGVQSAFRLAVFLGAQT